ncbi:MAG: hypothetical protein IKL52_02165 [Candidatus Gastranaerophilales bacterium]|nr:hypothetical protein [Candidatus Gastranaerophilales bacterium]
MELFQDIGSEVKDTIQDYRDNKLFDVDYSDDTLKFIDEKNLSLEELKELVQQKELKQISQLISSELTNLASNGSINIETYEKMQAVVEGGLTLDSLKELQKLASEVNQPQVNETYTDSTEIAQKIDELDVKQKNFISQNVGDNSKISSLEILDNGSYRLKTSDNSTLVFHETGEMTIAYDDSQKAGFDLYDSDSRLKSSFYIDRLKNDVLVHESYQYNEDGSYVEKIDTSDNPKIQKIVSVDSDSKISNVEILNRETGEVTQDLEFSQTLNPEEGSNTDGVGDNSDISDLEQEKEEVQEDLEENIEDKEQTEEEKENELGEIDDEISQGEDNLDDANSDLSDQQDNVDNAQDDLDDANDNLDDAQGDLDESQDNLDDANSDVEDAQSNQEAASRDNETARREEQQAQTSANNATSSYNQATQQTTTAQENKDDTAADVVEAQATTQAAFNVKTQLDQEVAAAQNEYQTAKAQDAGEDKSLWARFKNWVSSAWNSLCNLFKKRDKAEIELEKAQKEQERKEVIDEQAAQELERRHEEQDTAQSVMEAAYVVLEAKAGAREVSDQELADALLDLADAMMARDGAIAEHDGALNAFMEANNYKTDAEGNLINEQGELVSCQEIVAGLEEFIVALNATKQDTEAQYNETLDATIAAISGDYEKLQELEQQILALQENIAQERQELALQEQLLFQLAADKGALISAEDNCAIGDDIVGWFGGGNKGDRERYEANRALLEEAILSGDPKKLEEAYKAIYGDQEVYVDAAGNVVDIMSLSPEQQAACTPVKLSELSGANLTALCQQEQANAYNAQVAVEYLDAGYFTVDGQTISQQELNEALIKQAEEQIAELERAIDGQGWFSTSVGFINRGLGIGTTSDEARAQVEHYKAMVQQLETCTDPVQYAALYKAITGKSFSPNEVVTLCAYREMSGMPPASSNQTKTGNLIPPESQYDLSADIDNVINIVNTECGGDKKALSVTGNSKASQAINDYKETQENIVNGAKGMIVGLVATAVAIVAAPFTGGASLVLLCAAAGAGTSVLIGATDSIYDADGDGKTDFNYTLGEFGTDLFSGALTGAVSALTLGMGDKLTGALTSKISGTVATTGGQAFKQTAARVGIKFLGEAVEGAVDGGLSSAGEYTIEALANGTFNVGDMLKAGAQGATMGGVLGGGLGAAGELFSSGKHFIDGMIMKSDVDDILTRGGAFEVIDLDDSVSLEINTANVNAGTDLIPIDMVDVPADLTLADVIANNLDTKYIQNGKANPWAMSQITQNAKTAQSALTKAGFSESQALQVLNNIPTDSYVNVSDVTALMSQNASALNMLKPDGQIDTDKFGNFVSGLDEVKYRPDGSIESIVSYSPDGQPVKLDFDTKGNVTGVTILSDSGDIVDDNLDDIVDITDDSIVDDVDNVDINDDIDPVDDLVDNDANIDNLVTDDIGPDGIDYKNDPVNKWGDLTSKERIALVESMKNADGTPRFDTAADARTISGLIKKNPKEAGIILGLKNPDGSFRFTTTTQISVIADAMSSYPEQVTKLLNAKLPNGSYLIDSNNFNDNIFLQKLDRLKFADSGFNNPPLEYDINDVSKKINELYKKGYLSSKIDLNRLANKSAILDNDFLQDVDKLYSAMKSGLRKEDVFVPKFNDVTTAAKNINVGDLCRIGSSDKAYIKLSNGTLEELSISYKKYLELFPPVHRYTSFQGQIGDCYLISSIDQLFKTPEARANVLRSFVENPDGSMTIKLQNGGFEFTMPAGVNINAYIDLKMHDLHNDKTMYGEFISNSSDGYKILEFTYGLELILDKQQELQQKFGMNLISADEFNRQMQLLSDPNYIRIHSHELRNMGGWKNNVYEKFGLDTLRANNNAKSYGVFGFKQADSIIRDPDEWHKYIIGGGTKGTTDTVFLNESLDLAGCHAYSIEPFVTDNGFGEVLYKVTNPWHGASYVVLTYEQLEMYFDQIYIAKRP